MGSNLTKLNVMKLETLRGELEAIAHKASFASVLYTSKESGEIARHTLILGANYGTLLQKSLLELELVNVATLASEWNMPLAAVSAAHVELVASITKSLAAHAIGEQSEDYTKRGLYVQLGNGIQLLTTDGTLELKGLAHAKSVIVPGNFREVRSSGKTIAKRKLNATLPRSKFRTLCLDAGNVHAVKLNGKTIDFD